VNQRSSSESTHRPYTVALTGGIASGKTLVSDAFAALGVPVVDTDVIAHSLVEPGQPALREIEEVFGSDVIESSGRLDRQKLRSLVFANTGMLTKLEAILHPRIRQAATEAVAKVTFTYCILVIPLLVEKGSYPNVDRVLVVDVAPETQIDRLMARDNSDLEQAKQVLASQASREQRLEIADDVLENTGSPQQARDEVARLHEKYLRLAEHR
jgi:dephospho-CoA kinase